MNEVFSDAASQGDVASPRPTGAFGDVVRRIREARGLTQTALAEMMKQSVSYVSLIESGRRNPTQRVVANLRNALDLSTEEDTELQIAAGLPTSPLSYAVQLCIMSLEEIAPMDTFDRHVIRQDLTLILDAWKETLLGQRELNSGRFEAAQERFQRVAYDAAVAPMTQAFAASRLADVQEKRGQLAASQQAIQHAQQLMQQTVRPQNPALGQALRGDISGTLGFMAARAGETRRARAMIEQGRHEFNALLSSGGGLESEIVARIGIANSDARRALDALFTGDAVRGLAYAEGGLKSLPAGERPDITRVKLRLVALQAWAESHLGHFEQAEKLRAETLHGYESLGDAYGVAKSRMYSADDRRLQIEKILQENHELITPEKRRQRIGALRRRNESTPFARLLDEAISDYRAALAALEQVGDRIILARGLRNLGDLLRYKWLLNRRPEDRDECERYLNRAVSIEEETTQDRVNQGRRLPNAYESLALLAWDDNRRATAADWYMKAHDSLLAQGVSADQASEQMLRRIENALNELGRDLCSSRSQFVESGAPDPAMIWRALFGEVEQVIFTALRNKPDVAIFAEVEEHWQRELDELESEEGPRILIQRELSSALFENLPKRLRSDAADGYHRNRRQKLEVQIKHAQEIDFAGTLYQDICNRKAVEEDIRTCADQSLYESAVRFLREAGGIYVLTPVQFPIPVSFAIRGDLLLIEVSRDLVNSRTSLRPEGPGDLVSFSIRGDKRLIRDLKTLFAKLLEIGHQVSRGQPDAVEWLEQVSMANMPMIGRGGL